MMKIIGALVTVCITVPIWYFLVFQILVRVNASELMWFLFWVYIPFSVFVNVVNYLLLERN